ncbi:type VII secretion protein EccB [Streptomyces griseoviridis]|uniref:Type VII secretion protein EccB n=1 Tax=Streptomyces griseoviridis TaxID=45398 RepID=A0ABT9LNX2_STRGD|nr:type VII secretion protein EccB [Streptomyces griseoviridis]MDP9685229.1 type VII secretion protein EccB [Streptomyces griseoviridis]GGS95710.1 type VII secretion protein EccB [Streptomyces griseoviridis]
MQSRKDQVQAHLFVMGRVAAGLHRTDLDSPDSPPTARTRRGVAWGALVTALAGAVCLIWGLISPGGATGWAVDGTLVVVRDTGARYLYLNGTLHPVLNQTSARLLAGDRQAVRQVAAASLAGAPRGATLGIVGAPDGLPTENLSGAAWQVCAVHGTAGGTTPGTAALTSVAVGTADPGTGLDSGRGVLVTTGAGDGGVHLLWRGRRYAVDTAHGADSALGWDGVRPVEVGAAFLGAFSAGPDIAPPDLAGRGSAGPDLAGAGSRVGRLYTAAGREYVLTREGLAPLTELEFRLLRGDPRTQESAYGGGRVTVREVGGADLAAHLADDTATLLPEALPATAPRAVPVAAGGQRVCARIAPGRGDRPVTTTVVVADATGAAGAAPHAEPGVTAACVPADRISVRAGGGVLVRALSSAGTGGALFLVTDTGVAYPVPSGAAAQRLGYDSSAAVGLPARLLALLPTGPSLDPAALSARGLVPAASAPGGPGGRATPDSGSGTGSSGATGKTGERVPVNAGHGSRARCVT